MFVFPIPGFTVPPPTELPLPSLLREAAPAYANALPQTQRTRAVALELVWGRYPDLDLDGVMPSAAVVALFLGSTLSPEGLVQAYRDALEDEKEDSLPDYSWADGIPDPGASE